MHKGCSHSTWRGLQTSSQDALHPYIQLEIMQCCSRLMYNQFNQKGAISQSLTACSAEIGCVGWLCCVNWLPNTFCIFIYYRSAVDLDSSRMHQACVAVVLAASAPAITAVHAPPASACRLSLDEKIVCFSIAQHLWICRWLSHCVIKANTSHVCRQAAFEVTRR